MQVTCVYVYVCVAMCVVFGLGTWRSEPGKVKDAVYTALKNGYIHIGEQSTTHDARRTSRKDAKTNVCIFCEQMQPLCTRTKLRLGRALLQPLPREPLPENACL